MLRSLLEEEIQRFKMGNMVRRLIVVNVVVFIAVNLVNLAFFLAFQFSSPDPGTFYPGSSYQKAYNAFIHFFSMSSSGWYVLTHPWTVITHMFLHEGFWHILWNMLFLYWFGRIVGDFIGNQKILPIYLLSGFAGAIMYFLGAAVFTNGLIAPFALGASAAVMGITAVSGMIAPDYSMRLLLIGDVKLKYIVVTVILIDLFSISYGGNTGGHVAHLGGAAMGILFAYQLRQGNDWSIWVNKIIDRITGLFTGRSSASSRRKPKVVYRNTEKIRNKKTERPSRRGRAKSDSDVNHEEKLNAILEKIKESGYQNLTEEEKEFLVNASKK